MSVCVRLHVVSFLYENIWLAINERQNSYLMSYSVCRMNLLLRNCLGSKSMDPPRLNTEIDRSSQLVPFIMHHYSYAPHSSFIMNINSPLETSVFNYRWRPTSFNLTQFVCTSSIRTIKPTDGALGVGRDRPKKIHSSVQRANYTGCTIFL